MAEKVAETSETVFEPPRKSLAVAVGFIFLGEILDWRAPAALALILSGVALSQGRPGKAAPADD